MSYECTYNLTPNKFRNSKQCNSETVVLATNKFGNTVSFIETATSGGILIALPSSALSSKLLESLLTRILPSTHPRLFPSSQCWVSEFGHPEKNMWLSRIKKLESEHSKSISSAKKEITKSDRKHQHLTGVLTETGTTLVLHAIKLLKENFGFNIVTNVDLEKDFNKKHGKREDLWLGNSKREWLVEVKGIVGLPSEDDALQVQKYILRRVRDWNDPDLRTIFIVNHERGVPPSNRKSTAVFQKDVLEKAEDEGLLLATTYDLYRLAVGQIQWNWPKETIRNLFRDKGRISLTPTHYTLFGTVEKTWPKIPAISIENTNHRLTTKSTLAVIGGQSTIEWQIDSIQINDKSTETSSPGDVVGVNSATGYVPKKGDNVYLVQNDLYN